MGKKSPKYLMRLWEHYCCILSTLGKVVFTLWNMLCTYIIGFGRQLIIYRKLNSENISRIH